MNCLTGSWITWLCEVYVATTNRVVAGEHQPLSARTDCTNCPFHTLIHYLCIQAEFVGLQVRPVSENKLCCLQSTLYRPLFYQIFLVWDLVRFECRSAGASKFIGGTERVGPAARQLYTCWSRSCFAIGPMFHWPSDGIIECNLACSETSCNIGLMLVMKLQVKHSRLI